MRLDKYLADTGIATRNELKKIIRSGRVKINGVTVKDAAAQLTAEDAVTLDGENITYRKYVYIMMNKPAGVVSATEDNLHPTVLSLLPDEYMHFDLFPCGRLDIDTEGFLLLTNDGALAHALLSPKRKEPKTYFARLDAPLPKDAVQKFKSGINLGDFTAAPALLTPLGDREATVTISEGKFHQVKRMFQSVGTNVTYLKRLSFGGLELDPTLSPGEFRELGEEETAFFQQKLCNSTK